MKDIERLNMHIAWSALTKKEQITLHKLLSKAHLAYDEEIKSKKYRIYYKHESTGTIKETTYVFDTIIEAGSKRRVPSIETFFKTSAPTGDESIEEVEFRNKILLNNSIDIATKIAYEKANKQITTKASKNYILGITNESSCDFEIGDIILEVENEKVSSTQEIKNIIENSRGKYKFESKKRR